MVRMINHKKLEELDRKLNWKYTVMNDFFKRRGEGESFSKLYPCEWCNKFKEVELRVCLNCGVNLNDS